MAPLRVRVALALVGVLVFATYATVAAVAVGVLAFLVVDPPDVLVAAGLFVATTLAVTYLSYRVGTAQVIAGIDALELTGERAPRLAASVERLTAEMSLEPPTLLVADLGLPNAIALGAGDGAVVLDRSLFDLLTFPEVEAIVAHELAHLERRDGLVVLLAVGLARAVVGAALFVAFPLVLVVTGAAKGLAWSRGAPAAWTETLPGRVRLAVERVVVALVFGVTLLVRAHTRRREYAADDRAADLTGNPLALAHALRRIEHAADRATDRANPPTARGHRPLEQRIADLLATHPDTDDRVAHLLERADADPGRARRIEVQ